MACMCSTDNNTLIFLKILKVVQLIPKFCSFFGDAVDQKRKITEYYPKASKCCKKAVPQESLWHSQKIFHKNFDIHCLEVRTYSTLHLIVSHQVVLTKGLKQKKSQKQKDESTFVSFLLDLPNYSSPLCWYQQCFVTHDIDKEMALMMVRT